MGLYGGFDVHSSNTRIGAVDEDGRRMYEKGLVDDPRVILHALKPMKDQLVGSAVESNYNRYWLVDLTPGNEASVCDSFLLHFEVGRFDRIMA
jgi:transposase